MRRPVPTRGRDQVDPFLLIDEMGPVDYGPGEAVGAPDHPHRGFETVTYMLEGSFEHEDSAGHHGRLGAGDVQWMTAGSGIVHSEMPSRTIRDKGGRVHGFQVWVNLPSHLKMTEPRYQEIPASELPTARSEDGRAHVRVIAGSALGCDAVINTHTPITYQDWTLEPGAHVDLPLATEQAPLVYVFSGTATVGPERTPVAEGGMALMGAGDSVEFGGHGDAPARLLLLAGKPIGEPIARHGPFVMNTRAELVQAVEDYQSGRMGHIRR